MKRNCQSLWNFKSEKKNCDVIYYLHPLIYQPVEGIIVNNKSYQNVGLCVHNILHTFKI